IVTNCWLALRLEFAGSCIVAIAALLAVLEHSPSMDPSFPGLAGLAISFALAVTQSLNWTVRMASESETQCVAVERVLQYCDMPVEVRPTALPRHCCRCRDMAAAAAILLPPPRYCCHRRDIAAAAAPSPSPSPSPSPLTLARQAPSVIEASRPPESWPALGRLEFKDVVMRYRPELPPALRGVSFVVQPGEKVGVVGRTGSGKYAPRCAAAQLGASSRSPTPTPLRSTTVLALMRLVELHEGRILRDDVDIATNGLHDLRSRIAV
ncbi:MAG: hypothetical protein ACK4SX_15580, partial [Alcanivoracaceae bacterium]